MNKTFDKNKFTKLNTLLSTHSKFIINTIIILGGTVACDDQQNNSTSIVDQGLSADMEMDVPLLGGMTAPIPDLCNGMDEDSDGKIDEDQLCLCPEEEVCYGAPMETLGIGVCVSGRNRCDSSNETWVECTGWVGPSEEVCDGLDNDCDGRVDENFEECQVDPCGPNGDGCLTLDILIDGDCVTTECPPEAPYPVGCEIIFDGQDPRGCVANTLGESVVFLKEGNDCGLGSVSGTLTCSTQLGEGLNQENCPMNKMTAFYPNTGDECPVDD